MAPWSWENYDTALWLSQKACHDLMSAISIVKGMHVLYICHPCTSQFYTPLREKLHKQTSSWLWWGGYREQNTGNRYKTQGIGIRRKAESTTLTINANCTLPQTYLLTPLDFTQLEFSYWIRYYLVQLR